LDFLKKCYENVTFGTEEILSWCHHEVFDPELWVWVIEKETGAKCALGIAELDQIIMEGSLEWIQVLPSYYGKGFGKAIINELLNRIKGKDAKLATVSGKIDNETKPERVYRKCGFLGKDIWWILTRK